MHKFFCTLLLLSSSLTIFAQQPEKPSSVQIFNKIQKLNFLGSVLYIAAHPDDENTQMISYMANQSHARTGYLSLTRGDGGQNLIGSQLGDLLGVIRTQELLEARKIDGGSQFFTRANDFGYSKTPDETLTIWNKDQVLSDVVYVIRKFQPDIIINRFDYRTPGTTHGHHTSSAILSKEAFDLSNDAKKFTNQFESVSTWQPKRLFFNTSYWFYGGHEQFRKADKSKLYTVETGVFYPLLGKSNQEIAALSRSRHQSQGFGTTGTRGENLDYLEFVKGEAPSKRDNIFDGIDTSWNRVEGGQQIGVLLKAVENTYNFENPSASITQLLAAYKLILNLKDSHWKTIKLHEISEVIADCAGLFLEAVSDLPNVTPGSTVQINLEAISRSDFPVSVKSVRFSPSNATYAQNLVLKNNIPNTIKLDVKIPADADYTDPYWLKQQGTTGMYNVSDQTLIGTADIVRHSKIMFLISFENQTIPFERDIIYKYNDKVHGEVYRPFDIIPDVTLSVSDAVQIFATNSPQKVSVSVKALRDSVVGVIKLNLPKSWKATPSEAIFNKLNSGDVAKVDFMVTPSKAAEEIDAKITAVVNGKSFDKEQIVIDYPHISKQQVLKTAAARFIKLDIKTGNERIGYIMGAGDLVNHSLAQMGYDIKLLEAADITKEKLKNFDVIITGVRTYNVLKEIANKQKILFDFVNEGHTMIVQYNTMGDVLVENIAPFPLEISRDRVTEEDAEVTFLEPNHKLLNYPNKITAADFKNWKQEQGLYYPDKWDPAFTPILSAHDKGEKPKNGALLIAKYGKGHYIYTGLSFFRELPLGVSGAFRLMANMISVSN